MLVEPCCRAPEAVFLKCFLTSIERKGKGVCSVPLLWSCVWCFAGEGGCFVFVVVVFQVWWVLFGFV